MRKIVFALLGVALMAGMVAAADISAFTSPYARAGGAITFTEKLTPGNLQAAVTVTMPEVAYTTGNGTAQYRSGSWTGEAGNLAAEQGIIRLLGFDPAWAALPGDAVKRAGNIVTVTAGGGTYTVKIDPGTGRILSTTTPQRVFTFTYATALPVASRVEIRQSGRAIGQALRSSIAGGQASSSALSGLGNLLGFGGSSTHSATATAGSRGLGNDGGGEAQAFTDGGSSAGTELTETGLPAITITDEELAKFLAEGGLHLPAAPVTAE